MKSITQNLENLTLPSLESHPATRHSTALFDPPDGISTPSIDTSSTKKMASRGEIAENSTMEGNHLAPGFIPSRPYDWPHDSPMLPTNTALVIIDMQNDCNGAILFHFVYLNSFTFSPI
jgi:hypothetical protein